MAAGFYNLYAENFFLKEKTELPRGCFSCLPGGVGSSWSKLSHLLLLTALNRKKIPSLLSSETM